VDSGPGKNAATLESVIKHGELRKKGLLLLMGLPNATSVQQEMDALFTSFKTATYARGEVILTERLKNRGIAIAAGIAEAAAAEEQHDDDQHDGADAPQQNADNLPGVAIGFDDLATVVNGKDGDPLHLKPFDRHFTKFKILQAWAKIGLVPFNRKCVGDKKVRHELNQRPHCRNEQLETLQQSYVNLVEQADVAGLNSGIFDASIPVAKDLIREADEASQIKKLVETKGAFSASALWNVCGTRIGNAEVVLRAQKQQLENDVRKAAAVSTAKQERRAKYLHAAQLALQKSQQTPERMNDKDWIDIIRWVLPESKADGLLRDFRKRDAIVAKLESLQQPWMTYIPRIEEI